MGVKKYDLGVYLILYQLATIDTGFPKVVQQPQLNQIFIMHRQIMCHLSFTSDDLKLEC